jgi:ankyrin repeat protein
MDKQLFKAVKNGNLSAVRLLIRRGVDVNFRENRDGKTALMIASKRGYYKIVRLLLKYNANVRARAAVAIQLCTTQLLLTTFL